MLKCAVSCLTPIAVTQETFVWICIVIAIQMPMSNHVANYHDNYSNDPPYAQYSLIDHEFADGSSYRAHQDELENTTKHPRTDVRSTRFKGAIRIWQKASEEV